MQGDNPMIPSRVMSFVVLSGVLIACGCVTSVKVRKYTGACPTCQQGQYASPVPAPSGSLNLTPIPEIPPSGGSDVQSPVPSPYPAPPPEARRLQPRFNSRAMSSNPSSGSDVNTFE